MQNQKNNLVAKMSSKLKNNQLLAAELLASGMKAKHVAEKLNIRCETLSRWKSQEEFVLVMKNFNSKILEEIINEQIYLVKLSQNTIRNALENKNADDYKRANIGLGYIKSLNGMNTLHEKFKLQYNSAIESDALGDRAFENIMKILDKVRDLKLKGANASDEQFDALANEVGWVEKEKRENEEK